MSGTKLRPPGRPRHVRLPTLKKPETLRGPSASREATPVAIIRRNARECPGCDNPDIHEEDGQLICQNCDTIVSPFTIANEVSFGEAPSGAALVQGSTVHDGQRMARSTIGGYRYGPQSQAELEHNREKIMKEAITGLANALKIGGLIDQAFNLYKMAMSLHYQRATQETASICLYVICRRTKGNLTLLIDFASQINKNVFDLGAQYKRFVRQIGLDQAIDKIPILEIEPLIYKYANRLEFGQATRQVANDAAAILARMDRDWMVTGRQPPALCGAALILAARMNNFRRSVREVVYIVKAGDSTIVKRLEEFRKTKAGNLTVDQFRKFGKRLKSEGELPPIVKLHKEQQLKKAREAAQAAGVDIQEEEEQIEEQLTPPNRDQDGFVVPGIPASATATPQAKRRRGRPKKDDANTAILTPPSSNHNSQDALTPGTLASIPIVIPDPPTTSDDMDTEAAPLPGQKRKRGRKKQPEVPRVIITEEDLLEETELERAIEQVVQEHIHEESFELSLARARALANAEVQRERQIKERIRPEGAAPRPPRKRKRLNQNEDSIEGAEADAEAAHETSESRTEDATVQSDEQFEQPEQPATEVVVVEDEEHDWLDNVSIHSSEFEDDPDVNSSLLSAHEIAVKERIWVSNNHDWLRRQTELQLARELEAAKLEALTAEERQAMEQAKIDKRNKRGARADELEKMRQGIETAADATMMMLHKTGSLGRKVFSKHVDYGVLNRAYAPSSASAASSRAGSAVPGGSSRAGSAVPPSNDSRAGSVAGSSRASSVVTPLSIEEQVAQMVDRRRNRRERKNAPMVRGGAERHAAAETAEQADEGNEEEEDEEEQEGFQEEYDEEEEYEEEDLDYDTLALSNQVPGDDDEEEYDDE